MRALVPVAFWARRGEPPTPVVTMTPTEPDRPVASNPTATQEAGAGQATPSRLVVPRTERARPGLPSAAMGTTTPAVFLAL